MSKPIVPLLPMPMPTMAERTAHVLKERQGLSDSEIGLVMQVSRETANRYRNGFKRKADALRLALPECASVVLERLTAVA